MQRHEYFLQTRILKLMVATLHCLNQCYHTIAIQTCWFYAGIPYHVHAILPTFSNRQSAAVAEGDVIRCNRYQNRLLYSYVLTWWRRSLKSSSIPKAELRVETAYWNAVLALEHFTLCVFVTLDNMLDVFLPFPYQIERVIHNGLKENVRYICNTW